LEISIISPCSASYIIQHGIKSWPIKQFDAKTFYWKYDEKEVCLILEGEATLKTQKNKIYNISAGDFVKFPKNFACTWTIHKFLRKHYRIGD
tara:strand:+ start:82 stop:357 length:276 start_codon:yes stop_codon:yes gene_type:complete